jgi:HSP20 family protein
MLVRYPYATRTRRIPANWEETEHIHRLLIDAFVTEENVVLTASVPGLNLDDLEITMEDDVLVISGEINGLEENADYILRERFHGKFERRLTVNVPVDISTAEATYNNGVLRLVLPKAEEAKPHRITVNAAH